MNTILPRFSQEKLDQIKVPKDFETEAFTYAQKFLTLDEQYRGGEEGKHRALSEKALKMLFGTVDINKIRDGFAKMKDEDARQGELDEFAEALQDLRNGEKKDYDNRIDIAEEIGDMLLNILGVAKQQGINAGKALRASVDKLMRRFNGTWEIFEDEFNIENLADATQEQIYKAWDRVKEIDRPRKKEEARAALMW